MVEREEGGTPDVTGSLRAALAFKMEERVGVDAIHALETARARRVIDRLGGQPSEPTALSPALALCVLGPTDPAVPRLPIVSFVVRWAGRFLHHGFVSALLNDLYGVQARGGCACAGPYALRLLGIQPRASARIEAELLAKHELLRPGFTRLSFPWFVSDAEVDYVLSAMEQVAEHGWKLLLRLLRPCL